MKTCSKCRKSKPLSEFWSAKHTADNKQGWCKHCSKDRVKQWAKDNPEAMKRHLKNAQLKNRFGITLDEYEEALRKQGGSCAICERQPGLKRLHVDHCHETGRVRGILCFSCNVGIGHLQHDPVLLHRAARYLS